MTLNELFIFRGDGYGVKSALDTQRKFCEYDIFRVFLRLGEKGKLDRKTLSRICDIGEGSVRTILKILEKRKIVEKRRKGNVLKEKGKAYFQRVATIMSPIKRVKYDVFKDNLPCLGCVVRRYEKDKIASLYKARDYAIRTGCNSAMVLIRTREHIRIPYVRKWDFDELKEEFETKRGDLIVLASAEKTRISENGIVAICTYLSDELNKIFERICKL